MGQALKGKTPTVPPRSFCFTIRVVRVVFAILISSSTVLAQGAQENNKKSDQNPPVKVNILNVCTPSAEDQQALKAALARLPKTPRFATDF